jgi:hypothetical protein
MHLSKALDTEPALGVLDQDSRGDWDDIAVQFELVGRRMDRVREVVESSAQEWRLAYWTKVLEHLEQQWQQLRTMDRVGQTRVQVRQPKVRYDWWEVTHEVEFVEFPFLKWLEHKFSDMMYGNHLQHELDRSWANAREESHQKARQGLL